MSHDAIVNIGRSSIQIGKFNDRVYLMSFAEEESEDVNLVDSLIEAAVHEDLSKIFAKVPDSHAPMFLSRGFEQEAFVPGMYGSNDGVFLSLYRYSWRRELNNQSELDHVLSVAGSKKGKGNVSTLPSFLRMRMLGPQDTPELANLYRNTFETYPFPIYEAGYLCKAMDEGVRFTGVFKGAELVGAASAEVSADGRSSEMTDFAVNPACRKMGIAGALLRALEKDCARSGIRCLFTIARAGSYGINSMFSKGDYEYSGRLINNTNIGGGFESMNVWYKLV
ncbi:putative beta-lysine N-acetyltransferase [Maridesulfovibrio sp. FT414]|uniref:putative beta-lysine N-acetyltransferase n=1 Tax=Maridesulfovibrio sp. FT414 TaxID=2979469 RepID=UPI003D80475C